MPNCLPRLSGLSYLCLMLRLLFCCMVCTGLWGQVSAQGPARAGGFAHFQGGVNLGYFPVLNQHLTQPEVLGQSYRPHEEGLQIGGGGYGLIGKLLLGGSGYFTGFSPVKADSASVTLSSGTGLFNIGYLLKGDARWIVFPYVGIGGSGITLRIENQADSGGIFFDRQSGISFGEISRLSLGGIAFEAGISVKRFITRLSEDNSHGAAMIGLDIGFQNALFPSRNWADAQGQTLRGPGSLQAYMPYVRITVGGGGIYARE